jgi:nucleotide-binding universal stress UspA family protein
VGIDDAPTDDEVLAWAVRAARRRGDVLTIAHAWRWPDTDDAAADARSRAQTVLDEAVAQARMVAADVAVHPYLACGHPADVLLELARSAEVTVIGAGRRRSFSLGPVAGRVVDHAPGPVVVVRGPGHRTIQSVAVGVDPGAAGREASALAVEFAVEEARLNGARLDAVSSYWSPEPVHGPGGLVGAEFAARRSAEGRALEEIVGPYTEKYPEMQVSAMVTAQPPGPALEELAERADLIVVGSRRAGPVTRFMLGSVSRGLARDAACPVAIVRRRAAR